jgi:hypothetical protein
MPPRNDGGKRLDWEDNHAVICEAYFTLLEEKGRRPTNKEVSELSGFSLPSIRSHLNDIASLKFEERFKDMKLLSPKLLSAMYKHGTKGKASCAKLFFQIVEGFSEKQDLSLKVDALRNMPREELEAKLAEYQIAERQLKQIAQNTTTNQDDAEAEAESE